MFWRYCECKINQTSMSVSLCSGLKLPWVQNPKKNLEIELWVLKVQYCSLLLVTWGARRLIWAARQPNGWHDANDNARHLATLLKTQPKTRFYCLSLDCCRHIVYDAIYAKNLKLMKCNLKKVFENFIITQFYRQVCDNIILAFLEWCILLLPDIKFTKDKSTQTHRQR